MSDAPALLALLYSMHLGGLHVPTHTGGARSARGSHAPICRGLSKLPKWYSAWSKGPASGSDINPVAVVPAGTAIVHFWAAFSESDTKESGFAGPVRARSSFPRLSLAIRQHQDRHSAMPPHSALRRCSNLRASH